jgi:hypothetical protein
LESTNLGSDAISWRVPLIRNFGLTVSLPINSSHQNVAISYIRNLKYGARLVDPPTKLSVFAGGSFKYFFENPLIATTVGFFDSV